MRAAAALLALLLAGCVSLPAGRTIACEASPRPDIRLSPDGATASMELDVLTYNIEGLPKFTRRARRDDLERIGAQLAAMRAAGTAPDVVLFQEVFSRRARGAVLAAGYPSLAPGPSASQHQPRAARPRLPGKSNPRKGEVGLNFASSGLVIAAEYPLIDMQAVPFRRGSCAGMDCLANKGIAFARMAIPGLPAPVDLYTTHMNSTGASRVPERRHLAAHNKQAREIADYVGLNSPPALPVVFGGDFNMRGQPDRFEHFIRLHRLRLVHVYCTQFPAACDVRQSWDGDAPWLDTQDLQLFSSGSALAIRPIRVEAMFDGSADSPKLSDHDAFRVVYELSWPAATRSGAGCPAFGDERIAAARAKKVTRWGAPASGVRK